MRIASLSPAAAEILFALGVQDQIVCVDQFSNFPEEAKALPHLKDHQQVRIEDVQSFSPELVLTGTVVQERLAAELKKAGLAVVHQDPRTIHQIYESIRALGALLGCDKEAESVILTMQQGFNDVKKKAALLPRKTRVYIEEWHDPPFASGNWVPEIARLAGAQQFPVKDGELSRAVTLGEVQAFDPELIVISWCGAGQLAPKELLLKRAGWDQLKAIQDGHVRVINDSFLNRPGPRLVEGARRLYSWMFEQLHSTNS
ncbi:hypothetical protein A2706_01905 [Candidatus Peribacteria bacterium RIFCSPHIGHO2_01_FULL_51_35]|nr:MAG: hypothetical protein A2706_01905 [Candidatus Peribacteria bacterium RIFCSPHIGHO2_01_FULL_51_35]